MDYRRLGRTGLKVSRICLGTMMFGGPTQEADSIRIMHEASDRGVNFIDTANIYTKGHSEIVIGKAIADRRDRVVLATKGRQPMGEGPNDAGASRVHLVRALDESLKRLSTEYVDIYYTHAPDDQTPIEETLRAMDDMVRAGKVRYLACSNFRAWRLCEALWVSHQLNLNRFTCVQPLYNIVNRDSEVEMFPLCHEHGIGVVTYSPLARGILTGKYHIGQPFPEGSRASRDDKRMKEAELRDVSMDVAQRIHSYCERKGVAPSQFAIAWCLANQVVTSVIIGPRTIEQFRDNVAAAEIQIDDHDEAFIDSLVPPGEHTGKGFQDPAYPVIGRFRAE